MIAVYIAGASTDLDRAEAAIRAARSIGVPVTFDWVPELRKIRHEHPTDETVHWLSRFAGASKCANAVRAANVVWVLSPTTPTIGTWVELGIAVERQERRELTILASGPRGTTSFLDLVNPENHFDTDDLALARIAEMALRAA